MATESQNPTPALEQETPAATSAETVWIKDFTHPELQAFVRDKLGEKRYRADQIYNWLYARLAENFDDMSTIPKMLRERLLPV